MSFQLPTETKSMFPVLIMVELIIQWRCPGLGYLLLTGNKLWSVQIGNNMDADCMQITVDMYTGFSACHIAILLPA